MGLILKFTLCEQTSGRRERCGFNLVEAIFRDDSGNFYSIGELNG